MADKGQGFRVGYWILGISVRKGHKCPAKWCIPSWGMVVFFMMICGPVEVKCLFNSRLRYFLIPIFNLAFILRFGIPT